MTSRTMTKLGETVQFLEEIGGYGDSLDLLMNAAVQHSLEVRLNYLIEDPAQKTFICKVEIDSLLDECMGFGQTKREAKINAADEAISKLTESIKDSKSKTEEPSTSAPKISTSVTSSMNRSPDHQSSFLRSPSLPNTSKTVPSTTFNHIGALQELATIRGWPAPEYKEIDEYGEPHCRTFIIECKIRNTISEGRGSSKKIAKKQAAEEMLKLVQGNGHFLEQRDSLARYTAGKADISRFCRIGNLKISSPKTTQQSTSSVYTQKLEKEACSHNWKVEWYDFEEKGYSGNFHCFVKICTVPITVCCGLGLTLESAHNDAAKNALNNLKAMVEMKC